jgi:DNA repair protein RAD5
MLCPLFDKGLIDLEATCIFAPAKIQIFSTILINVRVRIKPAFFWELHTEGFNASKVSWDDEDGPSGVKLEYIQQFIEILKLVGKTSTALQIPPSNSTASEQKPSKLEANSESEAERPDGKLQTLLEGGANVATDLPTAVQPNRLKCQLRLYQRQALWWMLKREQSRMGEPREEKNVGEAAAAREAGKGVADTKGDSSGSKGNRSQKHPLWDEFQFSDGSSFFVNPFSMDVSILYPEADSAAKGGILADEMGMGKTVQAIALMLANPPSPALQRKELLESPSANSAGVTQFCKGTLVLT